MSCQNCGEVLLVEGEGIDIAGSGTATNPFKISAVLRDLRQALGVRDTDTVNLSLLGSGTLSDPFSLRANATLALTDLTDVTDPSGGPAVGEVPVWVGVGAAGHFEFRTPPPAPAGAVNVGPGLVGDGTVATPLAPNPSGVWGVGALAGRGADTTIGGLIYVDVTGKLRTNPSGLSVAWSAVTDKPTTFAPSPHTHNAVDISAAQQLLFNVGRVNGRTITSTATSSTPPPAPTALDLWFFPRGS